MRTRCPPAFAAGAPYPWTVAVKDRSGPAGARDRPGGRSVKDRAAAVSARVQRLRAVRVFQRYSGGNGPVLASGLAFQGLFAAFAAIWVGFSVLGLVAARNAALRSALVDQLSSAVPGLIGSGGAISTDTLEQTPTLSITGVVALLGLLLTAVGFIGSLRGAVRGLAGLAPAGGNPVLAKLRDLALALSFGAVVLVSAALGVFGSSATGWLLDAVGVDSALVAVVSRVLSIGLALTVDTFVLLAVFRVVAGLRAPLRTLRGGALLGAVGLGVLKTFGGALLGGASRNPLLASFAVLVGVLIFFGFVGQVLLYATAWVSVAIDDEDAPAAADARGSARDADSRRIPRIRT